jgi:hypothetical protein
VNSPKIPAINATHFASVSGASLTGLNGNQITTGTVAEARIDAAIARDANVTPRFNTTTGHDHDGTNSKRIPAINATHFASLSGANLTNLSAAQLVGAIPIGALPVGTTAATVAAGNHAHPKPAAASSTGSVINLTPGVQNVVSVTITASVEGRVFLSGSGKVEVTHVIGRTSMAWIGLPDPASVHSTFVQIPTNAATGIYWVPFSLVNLILVNAGTHTFSIMASKTAETGGGVIMSISEPKLVALFIPH